jgi:hypothetical protein
VDFQELNKIEFLLVKRMEIECSLSQVKILKKFKKFVRLFLSFLEASHFQGCFVLVAVIQVFSEVLNKYIKEISAQAAGGSPLCSCQQKDMSMKLFYQVSATSLLHTG